MTDRRPMQDSDQLIGGFRILGMWNPGSGGSTAVYRAEAEAPCLQNVPPGTIVSLRVRSVRGEVSRYVQLERRATDLSHLQHPGLVRCYGSFRDTGNGHDAFAVVFEELDGESVQDVLVRTKRGLDADLVLSASLSILDALEFLSGHGVVPRAFSPENILLTPDHVAKLIGIDELTESSRSAFAAPECADSSFVADEKSCVFSFGACLQALLTGSSPDGSRGDDRLQKVLSGMSGIVSRALSPDRANRFARLADVRAALRRVRYRELRTSAGVWRMLSFLGRDGTCEVFRARNVKSGGFVSVRRFFEPVAPERLKDAKDVVTLLPAKDSERIAVLVQAYSEEVLRTAVLSEEVPPSDPTPEQSPEETDEGETLETQVAGSADGQLELIARERRRLLLTRAIRWSVRILLTVVLLAGLCAGVVYGRRACGRWMRERACREEMAKREPAAKSIPKKSANIKSISTRNAMSIAHGAKSSPKK